MKKMIISLFIFIIGVIFLVLLTNNKEKIKYGEDIEFIQSRFSNINDVESCRYKIEIIGNPYFGPTNYHLTAVIIISSDEMNMIEHEYEGEKRDKLKKEEQVKITIEHELIGNTDIDDTLVWTYNQEFRVKVLDWHYVGEVYYLEEKNAIYLDVENL